MSDGIYASLNGGIGSNDAPRQGRREPRPHGGRARRRAAAFPHRLSDPFARRGRRPSEPWTARARARAPTRSSRARRGSRSASPPPIAGRCCSPTREARRHRRRACRLARRVHRRLEATVAAMEKLGAERARIAAALGPTIRQPNYEVGPEFVARFRGGRRDNARFFAPARAPATPCSTSPAISRRGSQRAGIDAGRGSRPLHLCRTRALLQLPPHHATAASRTTAATSTPSPSSVDFRPEKPLRSGRVSGFKNKNAFDRGVHGVEFGVRAFRAYTSRGIRLLLRPPASSRSPAAAPTVSRA